MVGEIIHVEELLMAWAHWFKGSQRHVGLSQLDQQMLVCQGSDSGCTNREDTPARQMSDAGWTRPCCTMWDMLMCLTESLALGSCILMGISLTLSGLAG